MLKILKWYRQAALFWLFSMIVVNCYGLTGTVTVKVDPGHQTIKTRGTGVTENIGVNTAQYDITASCNPQSGPNEEVKVVEPSWTLTRTAAFIPPQDVTPVPNDPGTLLVSDYTAPSPTGSWLVKMFSSNMGQWKITFTATVTYKLKNSVTDEYLHNDDGSIKTQTFTGTGSCTFKATTASFQIKLVSSDDFPGHDELTFGLGETGEIQAWSIDGKTKYQVVESSVTPSDIINVSGASLFSCGVQQNIATITVNAMVGNNAQTDTVTASVIKPSGVHQIFDPNTTDTDHFFHRKGSITLEFRGRYVFTPSNVSFAALSIKEWGIDNSNGDSHYEAPAYVMIGPIPQPNLFSSWNGKVHNASDEWGSIMSCKQSYQLTKDKPYGPLINVEAGYDMIGPYNEQSVLPSNPPRAGLLSLTFPIRYRVLYGSVYHYDNIGTITSITKLEHDGKTHIITVSKGGLSLSIGVNDNDKNYKSDKVF
jgi:hypothetical protein